MHARIWWLMVLALCAASQARATPSPAELMRLLKTIDANQHNVGDFRSYTYLEQKEKGKVAVVYETQIYRRSADGRFMMVFTNPKASQGQGYLRVDDNLWFYDPAIGKWKRRT